MLEPSYPLSTARMTLRPYEIGDLAAVHDLFGREDVSRYLFWEPMDIDAAARPARAAAEADAHRDRR